MTRVLRRVREGHTYAGETDLIIMTCPCCGITYAMPQMLQANAYDRGKREIVWYCPNGHELGYNGKSEDEKKAERLERQLRLEREPAARLAAQRDQAKAEAKAHKGRATRFKNDRDKERTKATAGVCPADGCKRHFTNLDRHMASEHPELVAEYHEQHADK